jgi:hypothetical protein
MSMKVRRGLGLLAVAALAFGVQWVVSYDDGGAADSVGVLARLVLLVAGAAGLVLVAWGLLTE